MYSRNNKTLCLCDDHYPSNHLLCACLQYLEKNILCSFERSEIERNVDLPNVDCVDLVSVDFVGLLSVDLPSVDCGHKIGNCRLIHGL